MASLDDLLEALRALYGAGDPDLAGKAIIIAEFDRVDRATGLVSTFRAATTRFASAPADTPSSAPYWARLRVPSFGQSILDSDWKRSSGLTFQAIELINNDGRLDAEFAEDDYSWDGVEGRIKGGLLGWLLSEFVELPGGAVRAANVLPADGAVRIEVQASATREDQPVQTRTYSGRGHAYDVAGTAHTLIGDVYDLGLRSFTVEQFFNTGTVSADGVLWDKRGSLSGAPGTPGHVGYIDSSGQIRVLLDDGSAIANLAIGSAHEFDDDEWHLLSLSADRSPAVNEATGYVSTGSVSVEKLAPTDISALTGRISSTAAYYHGALAGSSARFPGAIDEPRVWLRALGADEIANRATFSADGQERGLVGLWRYDENAGVAARNDVGGPMSVQAVIAAGAPTCSMGDTADPEAGSGTQLVWMRAPASASGVFSGRRNSATTSDPGYACRLDGSGNVVVEASDGTTVFSSTVTGPFDDRTPWGVAIRISRAADGGDNTLQGFVLDYPRGSLAAGTVASIAGAATFESPGVDFRLGSYDDGSGDFTGWAGWSGFAAEALDETSIVLALSDQWVEIDDESPTPPPKLARDLASQSGTSFWSLTEGSGTSAVDHVNAVNGTWTSAPTRVRTRGTITHGASGAWIGTLEGGLNLRGLPKPVPLGRPQRLKPVLIDADRRIYQYGDPFFGATEAVEAVEAGALTLDLTTDYTVNLTDSTVTLVNPVEEDLTVSVRGVKDPVSGVWLEYPGELVDFVWRHVMGVPSVVAASIAAYDEAHPYQSALWLGPCDQSLKCVYDRLLAPDGYAYHTFGGLALGTRVAPGSATPRLSLDRSRIVAASARAVSVPPPTWLARCAYGRTNHKVNSFNTSSDPRDQATAAQTSRYVEDKRVEVLVENDDAVARTYETATHRRADAALLVQRMLDLDGVPRRGWTIDLTKDHWYLELGHEVEITDYSRYDLAPGQYLVVGYSYGMAEGGAPTSQVTLWG